MDRQTRGRERWEGGGVGCTSYLCPSRHFLPRLSHHSDPWQGQEVSGGRRFPAGTPLSFPANELMWPAPRLPGKQRNKTNKQKKHPTPELCLNETDRGIFFIARTAAIVSVGHRFHRREISCEINENRGIWFDSMQPCSQFLTLLDVVNALPHTNTAGSRSPDPGTRSLISAWENLFLGGVEI